MRFEAALEHYKTVKAIARKCGKNGISVQAVYRWQKTGIVPRPRAFELRARSGGKLKVEEALYVNGTAEDSGRSRP